MPGCAKSADVMLEHQHPVKPQGSPESSLAHFAGQQSLLIDAHEKRCYASLAGEVAQSVLGARSQSELGPKRANLPEVGFI